LESYVKTRLGKKEGRILNTKGKIKRVNKRRVKRKKLKN
jgi:hypothetical protein